MANYNRLLIVALLMSMACTLYAQNNNLILFENGGLCVEYENAQAVYLSGCYLPSKVKLISAGSIVDVSGQQAKELAQFTEEDGIYTFLRIDPMGNMVDTLGYLNLEKGILQPINQPDKEPALVEPNGVVIGDSGRIYLKGNGGNDSRMLAFLYLYSPMVEFDMRTGR